MDSHTHFSRETFAAFRAADRAGPVQMLNLIRLRDWADYDADLPGHGAAGAASSPAAPAPAAVSGRDAYEAYSRQSAPVFAALGGRIVWRGRWELGVIGPEAERWDICFIAEYPSVEAFVAMFKTPAYREAMRHRQAAVADSRLIRLAAAEAGDRF